METESQVKPVQFNKRYKERKAKLNQYLHANLTQKERDEYSAMLQRLESLKVEAFKPSVDAEQHRRDNQIYNSYYSKVLAFEKKYGIIMPSGIVFHNDKRSQQ